MSGWDDSLFMEKLLSSRPAPEFLQLGPHGTHHLFPPHGDPDLLIWESTFDTLACAMGCHEGLPCKAIHLDVDLFLQRTFLPSLCVIGMQLHLFVSYVEWLSGYEVFEKTKNICLWLVGGKWMEGFIPSGNCPIVITINHDKRDCIVTFGCCCI